MQRLSLTRWMQSCPAEQSDAIQPHQPGFIGKEAGKCSSIKDLRLRFRRAIQSERLELPCENLTSSDGGSTPAASTNFSTYFTQKSRSFLGPRSRCSQHSN